MAYIQKEVKVNILSFFRATLIMPKEPLFERFRVQKLHILHFLFHCFIFPDSFKVRTGSLLLLLTCFIQFRQKSGQNHSGF